MLLATAWPAVANAQKKRARTPAAQAPAAEEASSPEAAEAKRLFLEGIEFAKSERWADATQSFEASLDVLPRASSAFNLASALYRLGRVVDAQAALERYRALAAPDDPNQQAATALLGELSLAIARLTLYVEPPASQVVIDGKEKVGEGRLRELPMDPGAHSLEVRAHGYHSFMEPLQVARGESVAREISLKALPPPKPVVVEVEAPERPLYKKPMFWVAVGAAVLAASGSAVAVALASRDKTEKAYGGNLGLVVSGPSAP